MDKSIEKKLKTAKETSLEAGSALLGFLAAMFGMSFVEKLTPAQLMKFVPLAVGSLGLVPHFTKSGDYEKAFGLGMMIAGTSELLKAFTAGQTGILAKVNAALPGRGTFAFNGLGYVQNGGFPLRGATERDAYLVSGFGAPAPKLLADEYLAN